MTLLATQITNAIADVFRTCTTANGYPSDIGQSVQIGPVRARLGQGPVPTCVIVPGNHKGTQRYRGCWQMMREIEVKGFASLGDHPGTDEYALVDKLIFDIRGCAAVGSDDLSALVESFRYSRDTPGYADEGAKLVAAAVTFEAVYMIDPRDPNVAIAP